METLLPILSDILLFAAALGAAIYCMILSRRLARLNSVDKGLGGAIAVLSVQVDDLTKALSDARSGSESVAERLAELITEAEGMANDIEEMLSVSHDITPPKATEPAASPEEEIEEPKKAAIDDVPETEETSMPIFRRRAVQEAAE